MAKKYKRFLFNEGIFYKISKPKTKKQLEELLKDRPLNEPVRLINIGNGGQGERVYYVNAKSTTLSAMGGGRGAKTGLYLVEVDMETTDTFIVAQRGRHIVDGKRVDYFGAPTIQRLESRFDGKTNTISTVQKDNYVIVELDGKYFRIRKLTPIECERLMNLPDNYTAFISDSQRYKCLGNGWDVSIIKHILSYLKKAF